MKKSQLRNIIREVIKEQLQGVKPNFKYGTGSKNVSWVSCKYDPHGMALGGETGQIGDESFPGQQGALATGGAFTIDGQAPQVGDQFFVGWGDPDASGTSGPFLCAEVISTQGVAGINPNRDYNSCTCPPAPSKLDKPTMIKKHNIR